MISQTAFTRLMETISLPSAAGEYDRFTLYCTQLQPAHEPHRHHR